MAIAVLIFVASCSEFDQEISIISTDKEQQIALRNSNGGNVHALKIEVTGYIDGEASMFLLLNQEPYETRNLGGDIDVRWQGDWYENEAVLVYTPLNVSEGELMIRYSFGTL